MIKHLAFIMDGNGRWAESKGKSRSEGHKFGAQQFINIYSHCVKREIEEVSFYAFSTENWKRSESEISLLFSIPVVFFKKYINSFIENNVIVKVIGYKDNLPDSLLKSIDKIESRTKDNTGMKLNICLNYGGNWEILEAAKKLIIEDRNSQINLDKLSVEDIQRNLWITKPVDLLIRTSGEFRISNFLLWQIAYSEIAVTDKYWPDFNEDELDNIISEYTKRSRRFGGTSGHK